MADQEHMRILSGGVEAWNHWRRTNPDISPNLRGADFTEFHGKGINLQSTDLRDTVFLRAELIGSDLQSSNLSGASFCRANLSRINLSGCFAMSVDFSECNLFCARMRNADLSKANLSKSNLSGADLTKADLTGADLSSATLWMKYFGKKPAAILKETILTDAKLSNVDFRDLDVSEVIR